MLWKNIKFYSYAAVIIISSGIYLYNLNPNLRGPLQNTGSENIKKYFILLVLLLSCLIDVIKIITGTGNNLMRYGKLTDEEKELYNISKVKISQILFESSLIILVILSFVPNIVASNTFLVCYLTEIVVLLIFSKTKWILNWFCKK